MLLKLVSEQGVDGLFTEVERIMEWYTKTDVNGESMNAKCVRAALIKNLPKSITQHLAIELRKTQTIDAVYTLVMVYLHDHNTGLPRGQAPAQLHLTEESNGKEENQTQAKPDEKRPEDRHNKKEDPCTRAREEEHEDLNVVKGGKKGKGKGYGACWHCGEWGHPRRECPQLANAAKDTINALKGKGKGYKGKGKGYKGKGKGFKGGYRSPGKAVGKGLNYYSNDDYNDAWGAEQYNYDYEYNGGEWGYDAIQ